MSQQVRYITLRKVFRRFKDARFTPQDPRSRRGRRHTYSSLINALLLGCLINATSLREIEAATAALRRVARRLTGITKRISDNVLGRTLRGLNPADLVQAIVRMVKAEHRRGNLAPTRLKVGVVALDGKGLGKLDSWDHPDVQKVCPSDGTPYGLARLHKACLISSDPVVCIYQRPIAGDSNEVGQVTAFTEEFIEAYLRTSLFDVIMNDAGNASLEHATLIHDKNLGYVFAIKSNCGDIHREALRLLESCPEDQAEETQRYDYRGSRVTVRIWRATIQGFLRWTHARQLVRVQRIVEKDGVEESVGNRYYVTNLVPGYFNGQEWISLVRAYWRLENEENWTKDVLFKEDSRRTPWTTEPESVYALAALRTLALNILSVLRSWTRHRWDGGKPTWKEVTKVIAALLCDPVQTLVGRHALT